MNDLKSIIPRYVIENGITVPRARASRGISATIRLLNVGQSFLFPETNSALISKQHTRLAATARGVAISMMDGRKFATRRVDGGVRIWRIA